MRAAPAARATLHAAWAERMLIGALYGTSGAALAGWALAQTEQAAQGAVWATLMLAAAAAGAMGFWQARYALPSNGAYLGWDGAGWTLGLHPAASGKAALVEIPLAAVEVALDLGAWLLLCLHPTAGPCLWQAARAGPSGADWHGLRLALQAHAGRRTAPISTLP